MDEIFYIKKFKSNKDELVKGDYIWAFTVDERSKMFFIIV